MQTDDIKKEIATQQASIEQSKELLAQTTDPNEKQRLEASIRTSTMLLTMLQGQLEQLRQAAPKPALITNYLKPYEAIPDHAKIVLQAMFAGESEVTVHKRFGRGLSGSLVYIVKIGSKLPNVVKIDYYEKIWQEWEAYTEYIQGHMGNAVIGQDKPVRPDDGDYAGLRYPLAGNGIFETKGLYDFLREQLTAEGQTVLARLFKIISALYGSRQQTEFRLQATYDNALPQNLVIDCGKEPDWGRPLNPDEVRAVQIHPNDAVKISQDWTVAEYIRSENGLELRHPNPRFGFRMQLTNVKNFKSYQIGQPLGTTLVGTVIKTRTSIFTAALAETVAGVDPKASTLPVFFNYPNPLYYLNDLLETSIKGFSGTIHGDLNLENIIVESDIGNTHVIDFAKTRPDHLIRDFLHLEMNLITTLLTETAMKNGYDPSKIKDFYERLHYAAQGEQIKPLAGFEKEFDLILTIRQEAVNALVDRNDWSEYERGLFIYLIGALRYGKVAKQPGLHILGKQTAFYVAATLLNILNGQFDPEELPRLGKQEDDVAIPPEGQKENGRAKNNVNEEPAGPPPYPVTSMSVSRMREVIISDFSEGELKDFLFDLGLSAEDLGRYKSEWARELIDFYRRRNSLAELQQALYDKRPKGDWWGKG